MKITQYQVQKLAKVKVKKVKAFMTGFFRLASNPERKNFQDLASDMNGIGALTRYLVIMMLVHQEIIPFFMNATYKKYHDFQGENQETFRFFSIVTNHLACYCNIFTMVASE